MDRTDARPTTINGTWRCLLIAATMALGATSAAAATPNACRVRNNDTGKTYAALQAAVDAAQRGDRLLVRGTCHGITVIDKDLVIVGEVSQRGRPILDGEGERRVVRITPGVRVALRELTIEHGRAGDRSYEVCGPDRRRQAFDDQDVRPSLTRDGATAPAAGPAGRGAGAGIYNRGDLTLRDATVRRGCALTGGGIFNVGVLGLRGASLVARNRGGGIYNLGTATLHGSSSVRDNQGTGVYNSGTFRMNGASSIGGHTRPEGGQAGGIENVDGGTLTMNDRSSIHGNGRGYAIAGGVFNFDGSTTSMNDSSSIRRNRGEVGGVYSDDAALRMTGSSVIRENEGSLAGGAFAWTSVLTGVRCAPDGDANVYGNTPIDCRYIEQ